MSCNCCVLNEFSHYFCSHVAEHASPQNRAKRQSPQPAQLHTSRSIPRTPLAVTLAKLEQAESQHLKDKVQMRRHLDQQRKDASQLQHRHAQLQVGELSVGR